MRTSSTIFLLCFLLNLSCRNEKNITAENSELIPPYPLTINVNEGLKNQASFKLSEVADSIRYVILSEERDVAVNFLFEVALTDSAILTSVSQCPFLVFDLNGKFLDTIGSFGRGPHEYMPGSKFSVDPVSCDIIVYRNFLHDFISFDLNGRASSMSFAEDDKAGFINDLDGGHPFFPFWTNREGDIWIDFVEALDMKTQYTDDFILDNDAVNPGSREKLMDFIKKLQPDDNPVLRMVYLKKTD